MSYKTIILIPLVFLIALSSCKQSDDQEYDLLFKEVMRVHDDCMPETANLYKLKQYAQEDIDVLPKENEYYDKLIAIKVKADKADEAMMDWMDKFKEPEASHAERMAYLKKELVAIEKVCEQIYSTIEEGKKLVKEADAYLKANNINNNAKPTKLYPVNK